MTDLNIDSSNVVSGKVSTHRNPIISVLVPVFNAAGTLERTVCSILEQNVPIQIILINDASTDNSLEVIRDISHNYDGYFTIVDLEENGGVSHARNMGIEKAVAPYLAFLDADDIWLSGKIQQQLQAMDTDADVVLVTCDSYQIRPNGYVLNRNHEEHKTQSGKDAWKELLRQNFMPTPTVLTHTKLVKELGGFDTRWTVGEDLDLWIKIAKLGRVVVLPQVLVHYFDFPNSLMKRGEYDQQKLILQMLDSHFNDDRLTTNERDYLKASRYVELSKGLNRSNPKKMLELLNAAQQLGYSSSEINILKIKRAAKRLIHTLYHG